MRLPTPGSGAFIQNMRRSFGTQHVVVIHDPGTEEEQRHELEAQVQSAKAFFDVDAPVYEGDRMEWPDPRGGTRIAWITEVKINQAGGQMTSSMSHIAASFSDHEPSRQLGGSNPIVHGDAIIISGSHVNVATRGGAINQQVPVAAGYEDLALAVKRALELLEAEPDLDPDDRNAADNAGESILQELVKDQPDHPRVKGALAVLRGVIVTATKAAAAAAASGLITQLVLPH